MRKKINRRHVAYLISLVGLVDFTFVYYLGTARGWQHYETFTAGSDRLYMIVEQQKVLAGALLALGFGIWAKFDRRIK